MPTVDWVLNRASLTSGRLWHLLHAARLWTHRTYWQEKRVQHRIHDTLTFRGVGPCVSLQPKEWQRRNKIVVSYSNLNSKIWSAQVMKQGKLRAFTGYAGRPGGTAAVSNPWEYSMTMQSAQFAPVPAGISAEQFRIWEAFEAGEAAVKSNSTDCCRLSSSLCCHMLLLPTEARCICRQAAGKSCWRYHNFFSQIMFEAWCPSKKTNVSLAKATP